MSLLIDSHGFVKPCVGTDIYLGNIRYSSLKNILNSELCNITRNIDEYIKGACKICKYKTRCYGCRGEAYQTTGDFTSEDPICWLNPRNTANKTV